LRATSPINAVNRLADVRQTLTDALDSAASVIATAEADDLRVHRVRRDLKCAAALIPLFAPSVGRATKAARRMVRSVHQSLGSARDVAAMQMTLRRLDVSDASKAALAALIETRRRTTSRSPDDRLQQAESLRSLALEAKAWRVEGPENALALKTIESAYRTARRLGRKAFKRGHPEELHRLRRRVIALGHRLEVWSPADEARNRQFSRLRNLLGTHRDLGILAEFADGSALLDAKTADELRRAIAAKQGAARHRAQRLFSRVFEPSSRETIKLL